MKKLMVFFLVMSILFSSVLTVSAAGTGVTNELVSIKVSDGGLDVSNDGINVIHMKGYVKEGVTYISGTIKQYQDLTQMLDGLVTYRLKVYYPSTAFLTMGGEAVAFNINANLRVFTSSGYCKYSEFVKYPDGIKGTFNLNSDGESNEYTYPLRILLEQLNYKVDWNDSISTISVTYK